MRRAQIGVRVYVCGSCPLSRACCHAMTQYVPHTPPPSSSFCNFQDVLNAPSAQGWAVKAVAPFTNSNQRRAPDSSAICHVPLVARPASSSGCPGSTGVVMNTSACALVVGLDAGRINTIYTQGGWVQQDEMVSNTNRISSKGSAPSRGSRDALRLALGNGMSVEHILCSMLCASLSLFVYVRVCVRVCIRVHVCIYVCVCVVHICIYV